MELRLLSAALGCMVAAACSVQPSAACRSASDCGAGWSCFAGECRKLCNRNQDCWPPAVGCVEGICRIMPPRACTTDGECADTASTDVCTVDQICVCGAAGMPCLLGQICGASGCYELNVGPQAFGLTAGGGASTSEHYRLRLFVAPLSPVGATTSDNYRLRLGPATLGAK